MTTDLCTCPRIDGYRIRRLTCPPHGGELLAQIVRGPRPSHSEGQYAPGGVLPEERKS